MLVGKAVFKRMLVACCVAVRTLQGEEAVSLLVAMPPFVRKCRSG
jgi:hypothetical protein